MKPGCGPRVFSAGRRAAMSELTEKQRDHIDSDKYAFPKERK